MASTVVSTATIAGTIEPPHHQTVDPSSSSRPSSVSAASTEDAVDRNDSCNSSPNFSRESEIQRIIPLSEVTDVRRAKTAGLFHNAIEITVGSRKHFFASFLYRDDAFKIINDGWLRQANGATAITEQQESISESSSQESGFMDIENVSSADILDSESLPSDLSTDTSMCKDVGLPGIVGGDPILVTVSEKQSSVKQVAEPVLNNDVPSVSWNWKEEDTDAPTNFTCASWRPQENFGYARELSFQHPIKLYLESEPRALNITVKLMLSDQEVTGSNPGNSLSTCHLVIESSQDVTDVPYSDYFRVEGLWDIERDRDESKECCILRVHVNVTFLKRTMWKGKIVQSTIEECREAFATWVNMAHELLRQKNVEVQQESVALVTQNGRMNLDREETVESSERSVEPNNPKMIQPTSKVVDATHNVDNHLQGNFTGTISISSLLQGFMMKFRLFLKNQSNLSVILVTVFALIFFMQQFSILVLLANKPQHINVNSPSVDYNMENGMERNPSDIAWMEKRIHHLKDEMYMVEARLERMMYEHALLKKQLQHLDRK
ncbi:hypothetical protein TanjilG_16233 [Lupinus angustifolius]|uniref:VASt domain-containing protein n=1 Tax=Lupinus angustifolius TaxID=3871 RepID=A0A1J7GKF9_LUPAN|nr:hypothetical protein TanjilG_16233 [Lupinus angustifolius]